MRTALLTRNLIKGIAVITAVAFLGNQLAWAGDLITPITGAPTDGQPPGSSLADFEAGQAAKVSLIGRKQIIEDF
ncbi:MAG: hypothetical protein KJ995_05640, partial [Candidatus Omnitrophica bacterium]|nr:hypothetical protein [Candidatus Omnitrophota bacterium]